MMNKRFLLHLTVLCSLVVSFVTGGFSVQAAEPVDYFKISGCYKGDTYFLYDENALLTENGSTLCSQMDEAARSLNCNIGVFVGHIHRTKEEAAEVVANGAALLDSEDKDDRGTIFLYLDFDNTGTDADVIQCTGQTSVIFEEDGNTNEEIIQRILDSIRERINQFYASESDVITAAVIRFLTQIRSYAVTVLPADESIVSVPEESSSSDIEPHNTPMTREYQEGPVFFFDEAGLFDETTRQELIRVLASTADTLGFHLSLYIGGVSRSDSTIERMAREGASRFAAQSSSNGAVYLYVDFDGKANAYDYLFTANNAYLYYPYDDNRSHSRVDTILYAMEDYFPAGGKPADPAKVREGLLVYCRQLLDFKEDGMVDGLYYIDADTGEYVYASHGSITRSTMKPYRYWFWFLLLGVAVGIIIALIVRWAIKKHYRFKTAESASVYTSHETTRMIESSDVFLGTRVSKVRINTNHSHGGGGHHGGHVGGGGGGHHR